MKIIIKLHEIQRRVIGCTIDAKPEADDTPRVSKYGLAIQEAIANAAQPKKKEGNE